MASVEKNKYIVVAETTIDRFRERCNYEVGQGYIPTGGVTVVGQGNRAEYFQSFILDNKKPSVKKAAVKKRSTGWGQKGGDNNAE